MSDLSIQISMILARHWKGLNEKPIQDIAFEYFDDIKKHVEEKQWEHRDAFNLARMFLMNQIETTLGQLYQMNYRER